MAAPVGMRMRRIHESVLCANKPSSPYWYVRMHDPHLLILAIILQRGFLAFTYFYVEFWLFKLSFFPNCTWNRHLHWNGNRNNKFLIENYFSMKRIYWRKNILHNYVISETPIACWKLNTYMLSAQYYVSANFSWLIPAYSFSALLHDLDLFSFAWTVTLEVF